MTNQYQITGMTCSNCEEKVKSALMSVQHVTDAVVSKEANSAIITKNANIPLDEFQKVLDA